MLKGTIQSLQRFTSASRRRNHVHVKWKHLFGSCARTRTIMSSDGSGGTNPYSVPREKVDCVVIGAGVVGIAVARALALKGREVLVIESASTIGTGTSSRNSEVVHAGIY